MMRVSLVKNDEKNTRNSKPPSKITLNDKNYFLEYDKSNPFAVKKVNVAFCDELADDFMPILFDNEENDATKPFPPDGAFYRILINSEDKLCIEYEIYWKEQICKGKDHKHDYEQIQIHFDFEKHILEKIVISSEGFLAFHGIHLYDIAGKEFPYGRIYETSSFPFFPWGKHWTHTELQKLSLEKLKFINSNPAVLITTCYHAFRGISIQEYKRNKSILNPRKLSLKLERLDKKTLDSWYHKYKENRFGHDLANPFQLPHLMYYSPPDKWLTIFWIQLKITFQPFADLVYSLIQFFKSK